MAEYKSSDESGNCIFCKIGRKEIEPMGNAVIYEDDKYMAFLSPFPNTEGFTVLITKNHFGSDVLLMSDEELSDFVLAAKKVAGMLTDKLDDVGRTGLIMEGTGINHAHIKLFPMHGTGYMKSGDWKQFNSGHDKFFETYEGYISSNDGPKADFEKLKELAQKIKSP